MGPVQVHVRMSLLWGQRKLSAQRAVHRAVPEFFSEYDEIAILHFQKALEDRAEHVPWGREAGQRLLKLERDIFLAGYYKAFLVSFASCSQCEECSGNRADCKDKDPPVRGQTQWE